MKRFRARIVCPGLPAALAETSAPDTAPAREHIDSVLGKAGFQSSEVAASLVLDIFSSNPMASAQVSAQNVRRAAESGLGLEICWHLTEEDELTSGS